MTADSSTRPAPAPAAQAAGVSQARAWSFVPLLYFTEGVPYVLVTTFSVLMYNKMGVPNDQIAFWTSLVAFPWMLKMLWGPLVDAVSTKRRWILATQSLLFVGLAAAAWAVHLPAFLPVTLAIFAALALLSATHDIAADGFYLLALDRRQQAFFTGIRSTFYRLATIFGSGLLVWLAGRFLALHGGAAAGALDGAGAALLQIDRAAAALVPNPLARAWSLALALGALVYGLGVLANSLLLPRPASDGPRRHVQAGGREQVPWSEALSTFFRQPRIAAILAFILFYRFGESMIGKLSGPFLQDPPARGGLGVPTDQIGLILGTVGVLALTLGGILGGWVISRWGIRRCLWPMVLALNVPNLFYVWAAFAHPGAGAVTGLIAVDQFGYGFGFSAYMVYLMFVAQGSRYETSHYAIATGLMALGAQLAQMISGFIQVQLGYAGFFIAVLFLTIPGMLTLFFIPLDKQDIYAAPAELD